MKPAPAMDLLSAETPDVPKIKEALKSLATDENDRSARHAWNP